MLGEITSLTNLLIIASLIVNLITMIAVIVFIYKNKTKSAQRELIKSEQSISHNPQNEAGAVFCRNCGNQYESTKTNCPNCKTAR